MIQAAWWHGGASWASHAEAWARGEAPGEDWKDGFGFLGGEELFKTHGGIFGRLKLGEYGSLDVWKICLYVFSSTILRLVKQYPRYLLKIQHRKMKQDRGW